MDVARGIDRRGAGGPGIDRHDPQRIAVRIEIVAQQVRAADQQFGPGDHAEEAIVGCVGRAVVEQLADDRGGPRDPVGKAVAFQPGAAGGQRIEHRERVGGGAAEADHHGIAALIEPFDRSLGRCEIEDLDGVDTASATIVDRIVARSAPEDVAIAAATAGQQIVAGARDEAVGAVEAIGVVVARAVDVGDRPRAHCIAIPYGSVGEFDCHRVAVRAVARCQRIDQHEPIADAGKRDDQIEAIGPAAHRRAHIGQVVIEQAQTIGAAAESLDPVVAVALAIEIDIVARAARDQVVALASVDRVGSAGADDGVVARSGQARQDGTADRLDRILRTVGERDGLDPGGVTPQGVANDDLFAFTRKADRDVVAACANPVEADFGRGIPADFKPVGDRIGRIADRIAAVAASITIRIVAAPARQDIVAQAARQDVVGAIAGQYVVGIAGGTREQIGGGPHGVVGKADRLDLAASQRVFDSDPRPGRAHDQRKRRAVVALFDRDVSRRQTGFDQQDVVARGVGNHVVAAGR